MDQASTSQGGTSSSGSRCASRARARAVAWGVAASVAAHALILAAPLPRAAPARWTTDGAVAVRTVLEAELAPLIERPPNPAPEPEPATQPEPEPVIEVVAPPEPIVAEAAPLPAFDPAPALAAARALRELALHAAHAIEQTLAEIPVQPPVAARESAPPPVIARVAPVAPPPAATPQAPEGPRLLSMPRPRYPALSRRAGEEGVVLLRIDVSAAGDVIAVSVLQSSGHARLDGAALDAARLARVRPAESAGRPVPGSLELPVRFRLDE